MNKTITVYELLGLVKDGKAPKKIKYGDYYYEYIEKEKRYYNCDSSILDLSDRLGDYNFNYLDDTVEIIEDNDKLENNFNYIYQSEDEKVNANFENIKTTLKDIVDHINKIEEKLDEK